MVHYLTIAAALFLGANILLMQPMPSWSMLNEIPNVQKIKLVPSDSVRFETSTGQTVAMADDGKTLALGAPMMNSRFAVGKVYVFARNATTWYQQGPFLRPNDFTVTQPEFARHGLALSGSGSVLAVPSERDNGLWIFRRTNGVWAQASSKLSIPDSLFCGHSVDISEDGSMVAIGCFYDPLRTPASPAFGVFSFVNNQWTLDAGNFFVADRPEGLTVSEIILGADKTTVILGSYLNNRLRVYRKVPVTGWSFVQTIASSNGAIGQSFVATPDLSKIVAGGRTNDGSILAYFTLQGTTYIEKQVLTNPSESLGLNAHSLALSEDGTRLFAGDPRNPQLTCCGNRIGDRLGSVLMFERNSSDLFTVVPGMISPTDYILNNAAATHFGLAIATSVDASKLVVGGYGDDDYTGAAWVYEVKENADPLCAPSSAIDKSTCDRRIAACTSRGLLLKWTGKGCRGKKGRPQGDGGCQCSGYCGYRCRGPCTRDPQCFWDRKARFCRVRSTRERGVPITSC